MKPFAEPNPLSKKNLLFWKFQENFDVFLVNFSMTKEK
jgi:hypothetical protein